MGDGEDDFTFATEKQRAVLELLANNRTSKEIAGALAVSEPAINRRIEVLRLRLGLRFLTQFRHQTKARPYGGLFSSREGLPPWTA